MNPVKIFVTTPRGQSLQFFSIKEGAKFLAGKLWSDRAKNFYTEKSVLNMLNKRVDEMDGYKFQYQE